ncbi:MAG: TIGR01777 family protein [Desulfobacteraceae bacterium]|jgi:uncharacterized protein (TIGR01777 family)|nr:MAG: TIGR01777 family protein [Desulfobacteraceae bacterium]
MKIFITGGTGFVGTSLAEALLRDNHQVTILTRSIRKSDALKNGVLFIQGDPLKSGPWQKMIRDHEVVLNLAGASIFRRWTKKTRQAIRESRILTTQNLVNAIREERGRTSTLISTSAVGYYGFHEDEELDESSGPGEGFLASVTREWEETALLAESAGIRVLLCRLGIVLGHDGGALGMIVPLFRKWLGSPLGNGKQWMSWIHEKDLVGIYRFLISRTDIRGPVNCTAPFAVTNRQFTDALGDALGKPLFLPPAPGFILRMIMGEFATVVLKGQRVTPRKLLDAGFIFEFQQIRDALGEIISSRKNLNK